MGTTPEDLETERLPTTTPQETLERVREFFASRQQVRSIGIGSFGPVDLKPESERFGYITNTPKPGWANFDLRGSVERITGRRTVLDTDVNASALAEARWGAARDIRNFIYVTVGTGIGGGAVVNGRLVHGLMHPEMGHIRIPHDFGSDPFAGACPYHGDCLEGLASGRAIEKRWGARGETLPADHAAWRLEAEYLAFAIVNWACTLSPERIILGGGVMQRQQLFPMIRTWVASFLNGYLKTGDITPPGLGSQAGVLGAIALAGVE